MLIDKGDLETAEKLLEDVISDGSKLNNQEIVNLILLLISPSIHDPLKALNLAKQFIISHGFDERIYLLKCYIEFTYFGSIDENTMSNISSVRWPLYQDCFDFILAETYHFSGKILESIDIFQRISDSSLDFVYCHYRLFNFYKENLEKEKCDLYADRIVKGLKKVFEINEPYSILDFDMLINEKLKGTYLSIINFQIIFSSLIAS